jgi:exportin-2 (importin alpha re-exporter)
MSNHPSLTQALASLLLEACKNPRCPGFSHYLFEAVAGLVRHCGNDPASGGLPAYEAVLFPAFDAVLSGDVQEFHPYVFQVLAQLIELSSPPLSQVRQGFRV